MHFEDQSQTFSVIHKKKNVSCNPLSKVILRGNNILVSEKKQAILFLNYVNPLLSEAL